MSKRPADPAERFLWRAQHVRALCDGLAVDAEELTSSSKGAAFAMPATYAFALSALLEATIRTRQALPAAFLAMVVGRLWHKHKGLPAAEATALLARMMAGEDQRDVLVNLATAAIDDWIAGQRGVEVPGEVLELLDGPDLGERIGGFEPPTGDEAELDLGHTHGSSVPAESR